MTNEQPLSRRRILQAAAIGAGAAVASAALPARRASAAGVEFVGDVTIGAYLITFVGAPISNQGSTQWSVSRDRTDTYQFSATADQTLSLSFDQTVSGTRFSNSTGTSFKQITSSSISGAVTVKNTETIVLTSQAPAGSDGYARPGDTTFYLFARPKLNLRGNPTSGFKYKFLNEGFVMIANLNQLLSDPNTRNPIGPATADAIAAKYPFREGATSGAALPSNKFKLRKTISAGPSTSPYQFTNSLTTGTTITVGQSDTFAAEIKESVGFDSGVDPVTGMRLQQTFAVGQSFQVTTNSVNERSSVTILSTSGVLWNDRPRRLNNTYKVKAWKTLIVSDEGPLSGSQLVAQGRVTDAAGNPVTGVVGLLYDDKSVEATTDPATGNYSLYSPTALPAGTYPVVCGDAIQYIPRGGTAVLRPSPGTYQRPINPIETQ